MNAGSEPGGEAACFLTDVDDQGTVADPRLLIRPAGSDPDSNVGAWRVSVAKEIEDDEGFDAVCPELAPISGETQERYRERLEEPAARSTAWRLALMTEQRPVVLFVAEPEGDSGPALLAYLRGLIS